MCKLCWFGSQIWGISITICLGRVKISEEVLLNAWFPNTKIRRPLVVCFFGARLTHLHDGSYCGEILFVHLTAFFGLYLQYNVLCTMWRGGWIGLSSTTGYIPLVSHVCGRLLAARREYEFYGQRALWIWPRSLRLLRLQCLLLVLFSTARHSSV